MKTTTTKAATILATTLLAVLPPEAGAQQGSWAFVDVAVETCFRRLVGIRPAPRGLQGAPVP